MTVTDYDFTTLVNRGEMSSSKWAHMRLANPDVPNDIPPFSVADLDLKQAPEIVEGLKDFMDEAVLGYTIPPPGFTQAVVDWLQRRHHWGVDPEWIRQSSGVVPGFFNAIRAYTDPGEGVIIQTPAYYPFYLAIERNRRTVVRNPLVEKNGRFKINFDQLEQQAADPHNKVLLFCSPHNPTGRVWTPEELRRVADIVIKHDLVLISDEIHFDLVMPGHHHTVMATLGEDIAQRSLICTAPSKTFNLAGMGTSNIIIPNPELRDTFTTEQEATGFFSCTILGYKACELAYTRGEPWLAGLINLIDHNRQLLRDFMAERLPWVKVFELEGTYLQWMDFRGYGKDAAELQRINEQEAFVFFDEGSMFGPEGDGYERMNLAAPTHAVQEALERLAAAYKA